MQKIIGTKLGMTQIWKDDKMLGITLIKLHQDGDLAILKPGILVKVAGISKSKGFQGVVKRHGFHGGPKTRGQKNRHRAPGSIGAGGVQRVSAGKRMAGRMGGVRVTIQNLRVIEVNEDKKQVSLYGAIPGNKNRKVEIRV